MEARIQDIIKEMTLEEKAGMCSGEDFWHLKSVERLGIPRIMVSDGPHGLRKQDEKGDHLGINESIKAVCFPAACMTACSFDKALLEEMGETIGRECQAEDVAVVLGPAVNIKRSPLCGRNFEYFSEDPYLAGKLSAAYIKGVQSQGAGTSIKHFAVNNQEYYRMTCSSEVDEQTLHEIYLTPFEIAVKEAAPKTVMCSYNKVNGTLASENPYLLTEVLRDKWGFEGFVMSDWGAVDRRVEGLEAGLELEMPSSNGINDKEIVKAVKEQRLDVKILDRAVERILKFIFEYTDNRKEIAWDKDEDHAASCKVAEKSAVLLKNDEVLPLDSTKKIAFIGAFAKDPRYQGGGSSHINSWRVTNAYDAVQKYTEVQYAQGYDTDRDEVDEKLLEDAVRTAKEADVAVVFAGLPESFESEGYDRKHMGLPASQTRLIREISKVQPDTVVVLHNGAPVEMDWADEVKGILEMYLAGEAAGEAAVNLLFGKANPCGRLAESIPFRLQDNPSYLNFPGDGQKVFYREGLYVGYRYYDKKEMPVRYPFGYGLSYTTFQYSNLQIDKKVINDTEMLNVTVEIENTGEREGEEVVQLYISPCDAANRPVKELKAFEKVRLLPGEKKTVSMTLGKRSFAEYNTSLHDWHVNTGTYKIMAGRSSRDIELVCEVEVQSTEEIPLHVHRNTTLGELLRCGRTREAAIDLTNRLAAFFGSGDEEEKKEDDAVGDEMEKNIIDGMPLRSVVAFVGMNSDDLDQYIDELNKY